MVTTSGLDPAMLFTKVPLISRLLSKQSLKDANGNTVIPYESLHNSILMYDSRKKNFIIKATKHNAEHPDNLILLELPIEVKDKQGNNIGLFRHQVGQAFDDELANLDAESVKHVKAFIKQRSILMGQGGSRLVPNSHIGR
jgi:hypothetical protein